MKQLLTTLLCVITVYLQAQFSITTDNNFKGLNTLGIQYQNNNGFGVYCRTGTNALSRMMGINTTYEYDVKGSVNSNVSWYGENGSYYPTLPPTAIFTSSEWGNRLLETGTVVNTVENIDATITTILKQWDCGVVFKKNKLTYRVGLGVYRKIETGHQTSDKWVHTFSVSKYYDELGVINQPSGIFVVENDISVYDEKTNQIIDRDIKKLNVNVSVLIPIKDKTQFSIGYEKMGGINFGFTYSL